MTRHTLLAICSLLVPVAATAADRPPNVVVVFADDLGYADLGCYGAKTNPTPHLDRAAAEGVRLTHFSVAQAVCSASRTALLTSCYPNRVGIAGALGPLAKVGIADTERTIADVLKTKGYATAAVGKWHLGHRPPFLPTKHGFDSYLGLPYSNDMWPHRPELKPGSYPNLPLFDGDRVVDPDVTAADQATLTARYTERAVSFIETNKDRPFFLYLAHSFPHVPLFAGEKFNGKSGHGLYTDVIREIDWSCGEVLAALKKHGVDDDTLFVFTSDNGPWLNYGNHAGSAGPLREGKGTAWEGGVRVPCVVRWPGKVPAGKVQDEPAMTIDLLPTIAKLAGAEVPKHKIDGLDVWPVLSAQPGAKNPHEAYFYYYNVNELQAVRSGNWKLVFPHTYRSMVGQTPGADGKPGRYKMVKVTQPELYDVVADVGETTDVAAANPDVVKRLSALAETARADLGDSLTKRPPTGARPVGRVE